VAGFAAASVADRSRQIGEVVIVGVDPDAQRHGVGTALTDRATTWLREQGMRVAYVSTGGDPGHAAARRLYERLGFVRFPSAQYFKAL
jgi:GNAT superfamily N-acetyltransferase